MRSVPGGEEGHPPVGAEEWVGIGPAVEHPQDGSPPGADQAGWGVPQAPAQRFGLGLAQITARAEQMEPPDRVGGEAHLGQPGRVGVEVADPLKSISGNLIHRGLGLPR